MPDDDLITISRATYTRIMTNLESAVGRIDAALALLDPAEVHHIAGPLADRIRAALTGQTMEATDG